MSKLKRESEHDTQKIRIFAHEKHHKDAHRKKTQRMDTNTNEVTVFAVTGISHTVGRGATRDEQKATAHEFIVKHLPIGKKLLLMDEPTNPQDPGKAVAVFIDDTTKVGYVSHNLLDDVRPLLDEDGQCDAVVTGYIREITLIAEIPRRAPEERIRQRERKLPEYPFEESLRMNFSMEEQSLQAVAPRLSKMKPDAENIDRFIEMVEHYMPFARFAICHEDGLWRCKILNSLRKAAKLEVKPEQREKLEALRNELSEIEGDMTTQDDHPKQRQMKEQLEKLAASADKDLLFARFEEYLNDNGCSTEDELAKLKAWFKAMPRVKLRNYHNPSEMAEVLYYLKVSRKELYDIYSAIIILQHFEAEEDTKPDVRDKVKAYVMKLTDLLSDDWDEQLYSELWDEVLELPLIQKEIHKIGKQRDTKFNRILVAHIINIMSSKGVFKPGTPFTKMAEILEGNKDHAVKGNLYETIQDRNLRKTIENIILEKI